MVLSKGLNFRLPNSATVLSVLEVLVTVFDLCVWKKARVCCMFALTDFVPPEDWGPEYPIPGTIRNNVPMPTLYSADGESAADVRLVMIFGVFS